MKAIITKYHGPTDYRGSRISASDEAGNRTTIPYPHELSGERVHRKAAIALCEKMKWSCDLLVSGGIKAGGYVFVELPDHCTCTGLLGRRRARRKVRRKKG